MQLNAGGIAPRAVARPHAPVAAWLVTSARLGLLVCMLPAALWAANPPTPKATAAVAINQLAWLGGKWRLEKAGRVVDEQWMAPSAGLMLGMARTIARGKVIEHGFMQVREGPGGVLYFVTQASGQKEAALQIVSMSYTEAVFENRQQDFPQKISYALQSDGTLLVVQEGPAANGESRRVELSFKRVQP